MKILLFLGIVSHAFVAAQSPATDPILVDPQTWQSAIVIERFASPAVEISVGLLATPQAPPQVTANVFLDAGSLLAPLAQDLPCPTSVSAKHPYLTNATVTIPLRTTAKPVALRVVFRSGANPVGKPGIIGNALVRITPPGALEALLKKQVEDPSRPLRLLVFGKATGLREMLSGWHLPFTDAGPNPPGSAAVDTLMIGETDDRSHLPVLTPRSSLFALSTDSRQDADSEMVRSESTTSTIVRSSGNLDWRNSPRLHRLLASHLTPR